jgi:tetratricopeptide (TPR) repeat protein
MELIINEKKPTLCLNMIIKNESKIISRLLNSVLPIIDSYCICDTGSTDDSIQIIENFFSQHNIHGKIVNEPFVNFQHNRNIALKHAYGMSDYILLLDADMILDINNFKKEMLNNFDVIYILQGSSSFYYKNLRIIKNNNLFNYVGVTHEYISYPNDKGFQIVTLDKDILFIRDIGDGGSKKNKFERDIQLLLKGIEDEPNNIRYYFYLANSYYDLGQYENAIKYYEKRIELGNWPQEQWYSCYRIGLCYKNLDNIEQAINNWLHCYELYPKRVENFYEIMHHYRMTSQHKLAFLFYNISKNIIQLLSKNEKNDFLFLHDDIYNYKLDFEFSIIAYYLGIKNINDEIIQILNYSNNDNITNNLLSNMKFYRNILKPINTINFSSKITYDINEETTLFVSSSSCLIRNNFDNHDGYIMNIRYVNYNITENGTYLNCDKHIITLNKYIKLTNNFKVIEEKLFDLENNMKNKRYIGIEDVKIFNNIKDNNILFIGTSLHENGKLGLSNGIYDTNKNYLENKELSTSFSNKDCEKNWVYTYVNNEILIIYEWFPLKVCKLDNKLNTLNTYITNEKLPKIFKYARGSTCGFNYNNELWFITHLVDYSRPRNYYHMLVVLDEKFNLLRYSAPFNFEGEPIEYSLSIIVSDDDVIINYSTWDRTTKIAVYSKKYIDNLLVYN